MKELQISCKIVVWVAILDGDQLHRLQSQEVSTAKEAHTVGRAMVAQMKGYSRPEVEVVHGVDCAVSSVFLPEEEEEEADG